MSAPLKPWESVSNSNVLNRNIPPSLSSSFPGTISPHDQLLNADLNGALLAGSGPRMNQLPPPVPPRPSETPQYGYSGMSSMYSSPYSSMYSSPYSSSLYSSYSSPFGGGYGGFGYGGYNRYGGYSSNNYQSDNRFIQTAEENSRQAFQSIESVVQAVGSVSMMLESTFCAVYSSFRAVIGVADQFVRVKTHMGQIFSFFALFRGLRWLYRRALFLLGIIPEDFENDLWNESQFSTDKLKHTKNRWPVFIFLALVFGTPWVIWKILSLTMPMPMPSSDNLWAKGEVAHHVAVALHNFNAGNNREISFKAGQEVRLAPKELQPNVRGWILGSVDGENIGLLPVNYIKMLGQKAGMSASSGNISHQKTNDQFESVFQDGL